MAHPPNHHIDAQSSNLGNNAISDSSPHFSLLEKLPDEILLKIFKHFHHATTLQGSHEYDPKAEHIETIMSARLVCRRLCAIASHFLLDFVHVEPTEASIRRLECISEHEAVRKEIRGAHISFAMYHPDLANSLDLFVEGLREQFMDEELGEPFYYYGDEFFSPLVNHPQHKFLGSEEEYQVLEAKGYAISHAWLHGFLMARSNGWKIKKYLLDAHQEYKRRFNKQKHLMKNNSFTTRIAWALSKMPRMKYLMVNDKPIMNHFLGKQDIWQALQLGKPSMIAQRYIRPINSHISAKGWGHKVSVLFPIEATLHLLAVLPQIGVHIQDLRCRLPIDSIKACHINCFPYYAGLRLMGVRLSHADVSIPYRGSYLDGGDMTDIPQWTEKLLVALLGASPLEYLRLSSKNMSAENGISPLSTSVTTSVLGAHRQGNLRTLVLEDTTIAANTLQMLMAPYKETDENANRPKLTITLSGVGLADWGPWEQALDLLRGGVDNASTIRFPWGNMNDLWSPQVHHIFSYWLHDGTSEAERYIHGEDIPNPFNGKIPGVY
ncbi:hypothetical protein F5Y16DRAFT_405552 [Xylariaceae sp. FL0255]|nr:hypothetical protein F5Y16DRAFT_405552 [Xylariaceae sp. FL0255]